MALSYAPRQPSGSPVGGQFAPKGNTTPEQALAVPASIEPFILTRAGIRRQLPTGERNWMVSDFDAEFPEPTHDDYRQFLFETIPAEQTDDGEWDYDTSERREAAQAISARLAEGQAGVLVEVGGLDVGDRVDLARLWGGDHDHADWASQEWAEVSSTAMETDDGETIVTFRNGPGPLVAPNGTVIPVAGHRYRGVEYTERGLVRQLLREKEVTVAAEWDMTPRQAIAAFIEANALHPDDTDYPEVIL